MTSTVLTAPTLEEVRKLLPAGCTLHEEDTTGSRRARGKQAATGCVEVNCRLPADLRKAPKKEIAAVMRKFAQEMMDSADNLLTPEPGSIEAINELLRGDALLVWDDEQLCLKPDFQLVVRETEDLARETVSMLEEVSGFFWRRAESLKRELLGEVEPEGDESEVA